MQQKFNEALVQQVREGKLWLECEGDMEKTREVLRHIFPEDETSPSKANLFFIAFHNDATYWKCNDQIIDSNPWAKVSDFFLQPLTEKEGKERTYRVTREQLKKLYDATDHTRKSLIYTLALQEDYAWETEITVQENTIDHFIKHCHVPVDAIKEAFPSYSLTPHIPKGEFAWVRDAEDEEWRCRLSAGDGKFYPGQQETPFTNSWKEVRKYEDRPF